MKRRKLPTGPDPESNESQYDGPASPRQRQDDLQLSNLVENDMVDRGANEHARSDEEENSKHEGQGPVPPPDGQQGEQDGSGTQQEEW